MIRTSRALLVAAAIVGAAAMAVPGVAATESGSDDGGDEGSKGEKICDRIAGVKTCVAVLYNDCTLWVSAMVGGCLIRDGDEIDSYDAA